MARGLKVMIDDNSFVFDEGISFFERRTEIVVHIAENLSRRFHDNGKSLL